MDELSEHVEGEQPTPRAARRRRRYVIGAAVVALFALVVTGAVVVQHRQSIASQGLAGLFMEGTPYLGEKSQGTEITKISAQQRTSAGQVRVAWPVFVAYTDQTEFDLYTISQATYDAQALKPLSELYNAATIKRYTDLGLLSELEASKGWAGAVRTPTTINTVRNPSLTTQYWQGESLPTLGAGNYRFKVCARYDVSKVPVGKPDGACSPELTYYILTAQEWTDEGY